MGPGSGAGATVEVAPSSVPVNDRGYKPDSSGLVPGMTEGAIGRRASNLSWVPVNGCGYKARAGDGTPGSV